MLAAMEELLDSWPGTLIVVSHDRYFLERVTDQQYGILGGHLRHLPGGVDEYLRLRASHESTTGAAAPKAAPSNGASVSGADLRATPTETPAIERKLTELDGPIQRAQRRPSQPAQGDGKRGGYGKRGAVRVDTGGSRIT